MKTVGTILYAIVWMLVWGFMISIGFWLGHKATNRIDIFLDDRQGRKAFRKVGGDAVI